jgi:hypothetical protein
MSPCANELQDGMCFIQQVALTSMEHWYTRSFIYDRTVQDFRLATIRMKATSFENAGKLWAQAAEPYLNIE